MRFAKCIKIGEPVLRSHEWDSKRMANRDTQRFSIQRIVACGVQKQCIHTEGGSNAKEHPNVVDVVDRLATEHRRRLRGCGQNLVKAPPIKRCSIC